MSIYIANTHNQKIGRILKAIKRNCMDYSELSSNLGSDELKEIREFAIKATEKITKRDSFRKMDHVIFSHLNNFLRIMLSSEKYFLKNPCRKIKLFNKNSISGLAISAAAEKLGIAVHGSSRKRKHKLETQHIMGIERGTKWVMVPSLHACKLAMPLIKSMEDLSVIVLNKETMAFLKENGIEGTYIEINTEKDAEFGGEMRALVEHMRSMKINFKDFNFWKYFLPSVENELMRDEYMFFSGGIKNFIRDKHPTLLVVYNDIMFYERIAAMYFKKNNIPIFMMQHGAVMRKDIFSRFAIGGSMSDKLCLWGHETKKWLESQGLPRKKIIVTGSPLHDSYGCPGNKEEYDILFATQAMVEDGIVSEKRYRELIEKISGRIKEKKVLIKIHPRDNERFYKNIHADFTSNDIKDCISMSKTMLTFNSGVIFDALIQGKNVISLHKIVENTPTILDNKKFIHMPTNIEELDIEFGNKIPRKEVDKFLARYLFRIDGRAADRIADVINQTERA